MEPQTPLRKRKRGCRYLGQFLLQLLLQFELLVDFLVSVREQRRQQLNLRLELHGLGYGERCFDVDYLQ